MSAWSGRVEYMPFDRRIQRLNQLADAIVAALADGPLTLTDLFQKVAATHRIAISQVKYGLTYAQRERRVEVDYDTALVTPRGENR